MFKLASLATAVLFAAAIPAQDGSIATPVAQTQTQAKPLPGSFAGSQRWIVTFKTRSFDLVAFRSAILAGRPAAEVDAIVADLEKKVLADQADFVREIATLGGKVHDQYWIINGCAVDILPKHVAILKAMPNVARLDADEHVELAIKSATSAANHNSDAVNAAGFKGAGVATAIVDTGLDSNMANTNRPHMTFGSRLVANKQIGAQPADDVHGHGTGVGSIVAGRKWLSAGADDGHAPDANIVGYAIADTTSGGSNFTTIVRAWQTVAADKATFKIATANNSYSGSPDPAHASQQALDSAALNADIMICVAAGNGGSSTGSSQSCANGLAVAASNRNVHTMASFSSRGPLSGDTQRFYPDITANGVSTVMARRDAEASDYIASGTSMASPQVCGAATLLRGAVNMRADETKAVLLATAEDISAKNPNAPYNTRNAYGVGLLRDDQAMTIARSSTSHGVGTVSARASFSVPITVTSGQFYRAAVAWMRQAPFTDKTWSNLKLEIKNGATVVASSDTPRNLHEWVTFRAPITGGLVLTVSANSLQAGVTSQPIGWAFSGSAPQFIPGTWTSYGTGCKGTGKAPATCIRVNAAATANTTTGWATAWFWHETVNTTGQTQTINGFNFLSSTTAPKTINTGIFTPVGNPPTGFTQVATGTMAVGATAARNTTKTSPPVNVANGATFYVGLSINGIYQEAASGNLTTYYWSGNNPPRAWSHRKFAWDVLCAGGATGAVPALSNTGVPEIGKSMTVNLGQARPSSVAAFLLGGGRANIPIPNTNSCLLLTTPSLFLGASTSATGTASQVIAVPNSTVLIGGLFQTQWGILDPPANALGVVTSNAGEGKVGG